MIKLLSILLVWEGYPYARDFSLTFRGEEKGVGRVQNALYIYIYINIYTYNFFFLSSVLSQTPNAEKDTTRKQQYRTFLAGDTGSIPGLGGSHMLWNN